MLSVDCVWYLWCLWCLWGREDTPPAVVSVVVWWRFLFRDVSVTSCESGKAPHDSMPNSNSTMHTTSHVNFILRHRTRNGPIVSAIVSMLSKAVLGKDSLS
eukprot:GFYU01036136.1.p3 GENE.GFYU01036136.1~~GFYU01036136.1.p3  ORF type:complete len:101 (-),score=10.99 GFYU01036136.1:95-397(-)